MKFCTNCGNQMSDDAVFCTNCGSRQEDDTAQPTPAPQPVYQSAPAPAPQPVYQNAPVPKKSKKPLLIVAALVVCVVLACILIPKFTGGSGYESVFKNFCSAINDGDINKLYKVLPPASETAVKALVSLSGISSADVMNEIIGDLGDYGIHASYKINDAVRMTPGELSYYSSDSLGGTVTDGYYVDVTLILTVDGETEDDRETIEVIKVGSRWCFADFSF